MKRRTKLNLDLEIRELGKTIFGSAQKLGKKSPKDKLKKLAYIMRGSGGGQCTNPGGGCPACNPSFAPPIADI